MIDDRLRDGMHDREMKDTQKGRKIDGLDSSVGKEFTFTFNAVDKGDTGLILASGRSPGGGNGNHSSILAWEIPGTEEPGGLQCPQSQ